MDYDLYFENIFNNKTIYMYGKQVSTRIFLDAKSHPSLHKKT